MLATKLASSNTLAYLSHVVCLKPSHYNYTILTEVFKTGCRTLQLESYCMNGSCAMLQLESYCTTYYTTHKVQHYNYIERVILNGSCTMLATKLASSNTLAYMSWPCSQASQFHSAATRRKPGGLGTRLYMSHVVCLEASHYNYTILTELHYTY